MTSGLLDVIYAGQGMLCAVHSNVVVGFWETMLEFMRDYKMLTLHQLPT
jgi:hypothetical protein